jgi:ribosomal-protein-alanine N-acetyltransferase
VQSVFDHFPVLTLANGVRLRPLNPREDAASFLHYMQHQDIRQFVANEEIPSTMDHAFEELSYWSDLFRYKRSFYWGIEDTTLMRLIGTCGFNQWSKEQYRAELSYDLDVNYWGRGIMTAALSQLLQFAWTNLKTQRIQATVATHNFASLRVLTKIGFVQEGLMRSYGVINDQMHDSLMMGVIAPESS